MKIQLSAEQKKKEAIRIIWIMAGCALYAFCMNILLVPSGIYSGGFMGVSQIIRTLLRDYAGINFGSTDIAGIINFAFNIPLFIAARRLMGNMYLIRTFMCIFFDTFFLTIIPVPSAPLIDTQLTAVIIGGIGAGIGGGIALRSGANGGGIDLVGTMVIQKLHNVKMSTVSNVFNLAVYAVMMLLFDIQMVIYSAIYSVIYMLSVDQIFSQNINVEVHIITKPEAVEGMQKEVFSSLRRGITKWNGVGAYTGKDRELLYVLVNKYELSHLIWIVRRHDEEALIVQNVGVRITGNFEKRIT